MKWLVPAAIGLILGLDLVIVAVFAGQPDIQFVCIAALVLGCSYLAMDDTSQDDV